MGKTKGMKGVDIPVFTPLKAVKNPGGNQREKSREKAAKKQKEAEKKKSSCDKGANKGMTLEERRHRDAEIMRQKQVAKQGGAEGGAVGGASN